MEDNDTYKLNIGNFYRLLYQKDNSQESLKNFTPFTSSHIFITSLSEEEDALPMWHSTYTDACYGCAIGIHHKRFKSQADGNTQLFNNVTRPLYVDTLHQDKKVAPNDLKPSNVKSNECEAKESDKISIDALGLFKILYLPKDRNRSKNLQPDHEGIEKFDAIQKAIAELHTIASDIPISLIHTFIFPLTPLIKSENYRHEAEYRLICFL